MSLAFEHHPRWREYVTVEERDLTNRWSMHGWASIQKIGRKWDSGVPGAPLFKTKTEAHEYLSRFVCDMIPLRCHERAELADAQARGEGR